MGAGRGSVPHRLRGAGASLAAIKRFQGVEPEKLSLFSPELTPEMGSTPPPHPEARLRSKSLEGCSRRRCAVRFEPLFVLQDAPPTRLRTRPVAENRLPVIGTESRAAEAVVMAVPCLNRVETGDRRPRRVRAIFFQEASKGLQFPANGLQTACNFLPNIAISFPDSRLIKGLRARSPRIREFTIEPSARQEKTVVAKQSLLLGCSNDRPARALRFSGD